jgi:hypothetical protein
MWVLPVVRVGAVSLGHFTVVGQVIVPDVWVTSKANANDREVGTLSNVNVLFAAIVFVK